MATLKIAMARYVANEGGGWADHLARATEWYNKTPHRATHGSPDSAAVEGPSQFLTLRDNAEGYARNRELTLRRKAALGSAEEGGAFRAPIPTGARGFNPR